MATVLTRRRRTTVVTVHLRTALRLRQLLLTCGERALSWVRRAPDFLQEREARVSEVRLGRALIEVETRSGADRTSEQTCPGKRAPRFLAPGPLYPPGDWCLAAPPAAQADRPEPAARQRRRRAIAGGSAAHCHGRRQGRRAYRRWGGDPLVLRVRVDRVSQADGHQPLGLPGGVTHAPCPTASPPQSLSPLPGRPARTARWTGLVTE